MPTEEEHSSIAEHSRGRRREGHWTEGQSGWPASLYIFAVMVSLSHSWLTVKEVVVIKALEEFKIWICDPSQECQTQCVTTISVTDKNIFVLM